MSTDTPPSTPPQFRGIGPRTGVVAVLLVCAAVFWPRLGTTGLSMSEGHRVLPGWAMLESGDWLVPRLFGMAYLRKPPGMPWAVAAFSFILGPSELAARAVSAASATLMALTAFVFAWRWYGPRWAAAAGLASALFPVFWESARSAEIEALNHAGTLLAIGGILDLIVRKEARQSWWRAAPIAAGLLIAGLAKGPASAPCLAAAAFVAWLDRREPRAAIARPLVPGVLLPAALLAFVTWRMLRGLGSEPAVTQGVSEFMWKEGRPVLDVIKLAPESLLLALPVSLALLFPWGPDARRDSQRSDDERRAWIAARAVASTCLISLALLTVLGVYNPRYTLPAFTVVPLAAPYVFLSAFRSRVPLRASVTRCFLLGHPAAWPALLLAASIGYILYQEHDRAGSSGRAAGQAIAGLLPDGADVWADGMIEARPEVLHYAIAAAGEQGRRVTGRWVPGLADGGPQPVRGVFLLLRADPGLEMDAFAAKGVGDRLETLARGRVHKFDFVLCRVTE